MRRLGGFLLCAMASFAGRADPDEAWLLRAELPADVEPLLAIVIDIAAAGSQTLQAREPFDPLRDYGAALAADLRCDSARVYWRRGAGPPPACLQQTGLALEPANSATGLHCVAARAPLLQSGYFIASRAAQWRAAGRHWSAPAARSEEAVECRADRGRHGASAGPAYASDGVGGPWSDAPADEIAWDLAPHSEPYIFYTGNFLNYVRSDPATSSRAVSDVALKSLAAALAATAGLQAALIRVDPDGPAGGFVARASAPSAVAAADLERIATEAAGIPGSLDETLEETSAWLSGGPIRFGTDPRADAAAAEPSAPGIYHSPFEHACRPVTVAVLSSSAPTDDPDLGKADLRDDLAGAQRVNLFALDPAALDDPLAFVNLVARGFQHDATVPASPQLSAAGIVPFAGDEHEPGVVFGLTAPAARQRWNGNLIRYTLRGPASPLAPPTLVDRDGEPAIDPASGLPWPDSQSLWSDAPDADLLAGGAAGRLPAPDDRRIHTDIAGPRLLDPDNRLAPGNPLIDRRIVGLTPTDPETLEELLAWPASLRTLGDPGRFAPIVVDYPEEQRQIVFSVTHDGLLQAFDAESGRELWAWMPRDLLPRLPDLMRNEPSVTRGHGIDGPLVVHRHDPDGDGRIDAGAGEHLWLMFGLGRGGNRYYALDIASGADPKLLWSFELPDADVAARAEPVITRLAIDGSGQSRDHWVVLLAGGYDPSFDSPRAAGTVVGDALLFVDAENGRLLWSGVAGLASLASAPRALDVDGDRHVDRVYLIDVAGGLWRVDITSGNSAGELARARQIARLGSGTQRFYATPDVSLARFGAGDRMVIAAGSGWLARPRDFSIVDRVYAIFDRDTADGGVLEEADLYDATDDAVEMPPTAPGWFARLERHGPGEKVIGPTATFDHALHFQTYEPLPADEAEPCGPPRAVLRRYTLDVRSGLPRTTATESEEDEPGEIVASGLPADLRFGFPDRWEDPCAECRPRPFGMAGAEMFDTGYAGDPVKTSWRKLTPPPASP